MKFCTYCGARLTVGAAAFCAECGKPLTDSVPQTESQKDEIPQTQQQKHILTSKPKNARKKRGKPPRTQKSRPAPESAPPDDGYDGYYDDVPPADNGHSRKKLEPELIRRIILLGAGVILLITLAVLAMYFL
jgi:hypothetical protein